MTAFAIPGHVHKDGTTHSHEGGHTGHYHPEDGPNSKIAGAEGGQYEVPLYVVHVSHGTIAPGFSVFCTRIAWDSGYLRYTPAKGFNGHDGAHTFVRPYAEIISVEEIKEQA